MNQLDSSKQQEAEAVGKISILAGRHFYSRLSSYFPSLCPSPLTLFVANCLKSKFCCKLTDDQKENRETTITKDKLRDKQRIAQRITHSGEEAVARQKNKPHLTFQKLKRITKLLCIWIIIEMKKHKWRVMISRSTGE